MEKYKILALSKTVGNLPNKYTDAILDFLDERNNGDGWWIYLKPPYYNNELECRIIHEQHIVSCISILKSIVDNKITKD